MISYVALVQRYSEIILEKGLHGVSHALPNSNSISNYHMTVLNANLRKFIFFLSKMIIYM